LLPDPPDLQNNPEIALRRRKCDWRSVPVLRPMQHPFGKALAHFGGRTAAGQASFVAASLEQPGT
jgi:hypothetical protein